MTGLNHIGQALGELTKFSFVIGIGLIDPELVADDETSSNHLIEKPVLQNDFPHVPRDLFGKIEGVLACDDSQPMHLRDLFSKPLIHLETGSLSSLGMIVLELWDTA